MADNWDGRYPDPETWLRVEAKLRKAAEKGVTAMEQRARAREREGLDRQLEAARLRRYRLLDFKLVTPHRQDV